MIEKRMPLKFFMLVLSMTFGTAVSAASPVYLFSYFIDNGQDGLHFAYSQNGFQWRNFSGNPTWLTPTVGSKLMRDPCIIQGSEGTFHLVHTTGWGDKGIGIAHSKNLIDWEDQSFVPVMEHDDRAINCWAPEILYNQKTESYLIYWSTTIEGEFAETLVPHGDKLKGKPLNHRVYCTTTKDFEIFTETKLFYDPGFNVIDPVIVPMENRQDGARYIMILKDETRQPVQKNLRVARSRDLFGPWQTQSKSFSPNWVEGPSLVRVGDVWICYFDRYAAGRYGAMKTTDFDSWTDISEQVQFPRGARHGTVFQISDAQFAALVDHLKVGTNLENR